ncbi:MAG TPA: DUF6789 family protein [Terriglobales bacterium]|nr:DUF6789 family protein [Terriglobales bacterium]
MSTGVSKKTASRNHRGRVIVGGIAGTALMTLLSEQLSRRLDGDTVNHADFLAGLTHSGRAVGELEHYTLGGIMMPMAYSRMRSVLPGPKILKGLEWGALLWVAAETSLSPAAGKGIFETQAQNPRGALLASLAGHLAYGVTQAMIAD